MRNLGALAGGCPGTIGHGALRRAIRNLGALAEGCAGTIGHCHRGEPCATWRPSRGGALGPLGMNLGVNLGMNFGDAFGGCVWG